MVSRPVVSSIRSRHTGHVGSSMSAGVGGGTGFVDSEDGGREAPVVDAGDTAAIAAESEAFGVNGS